MNKFMLIAIDGANAGFLQDDMPIGSVLVPFTLRV